MKKLTKIPKQPNPEKMFVFGGKDPAFILCRPANGLVVLRRTRSGKHALDPNTPLKGDIRFAIGSLTAARHLSTVAFAIQRKMEAALAEQVAYGKVAA